MFDDPARTTPIDDGTAVGNGDQVWVRPYSVSLVLAVLALGVVVGLSEELITRGVAVTMLRRAGHKEWLVMVGSSLIPLVG